MLFSRNNYTVVTLYTNLGQDGVVYGVSQVEAKLVITQQKLTKNLLATLKTFENQVKNVVYIEDHLRKSEALQLQEDLAGVITNPISQIIAIL